MTEDRRSGEDRRTHTRGGRRSTDPPLLCPFCGSGDLRVVDTKGARRRRQCKDDGCKRRFNTTERVESY
jgi:hypothetical protein